MTEKLSAYFKGLKVVEFANVLAGPSVGTFFAELGAEVIKVENKLTGGDLTRKWKLPEESDESKISSYYASANWGKQSVFLNLKDDVDLSQAYELVRSADIVLTNMALPHQEHCGITFEHLKKYKPDVIHGNVTGFGDTNTRLAFDLVLQAESGYMSMNGTPESGPVKMPLPLIDTLAAHQLREGLLIALIEKGKTGKGSYVSVSLFDAAISALSNQASNWLMAGHLPKPIGSLHPNIAPYGESFTTSDNRTLLLAVGNDKQFKALCTVLGLEDLLSDIRFLNNQQRVLNRAVLKRLLEGAITDRALDKLLKKLTEHGVPAGELKDLKQVFEDPGIQELLNKSGNGGIAVKNAVFDIKFN